MNAGTESDFNYVFDAAKKTSSSSLRNDLLAALACSKDSVLVRTYLDDQLSNSSGIVTALVNVANRPGGYLIAWDYLKANWDEIYSKFVDLSYYRLNLSVLSVKMLIRVF